MEISRQLRNYNLIVELDLTGASFSKQFKKANKLNAKSIIIVGDDEALKKEFIIRLFNKEMIENKEETISIENEISLKNWLNNNLLLK